MILSRPFFFPLAYRIVSDFVHAGTAHLRIQWVGFPTHPHIHNPVGQKVYSPAHWKYFGVYERISLSFSGFT